MVEGAGKGATSPLPLDVDEERASAWVVARADPGGCGEGSGFRWTLMLSRSAIMEFDALIRATQFFAQR